MTSDVAGMSPQELRAQAREARRVRVQLARSSGAEFNRYCLKDEETGGPITNAPYHDEWHVMADMHRKCVLWAHVESGKTQQMSIGRPLFELGRNHELRCVVLSATQGQAEKIVTSCAEYIERSSELREVFPTLVPGRRWMQTQITVRRKSHAKDPSLQATGVHGSILGARIDRLFLDDILRWENVRTDEQRKNLKKWYNATFSGRLTAKSRVFAVTTAWHPDDLMHDLAERKGWFSKRYPVIREDGTLNWPQKWSLERINAFKEDPGLLEFNRQLRCLAAADELQRCKQEWIDRCVIEGDGLPMVTHLRPSQLAPGCFTVTGVDLAAKRRGGTKKSATALTVLFTILVYPDGVMRLLEITAGQFTAPEIRDAIIDTQSRFGSVVFVEDNGVQGWIIEITEEKSAGLPVFPFGTGVNKHHPSYGVESVFVGMSSGKWCTPSRDLKVSDEVQAWFAECLAYHPTAHTGDRLMASWFAKEGARRLLATQPSEDGDVDVTVVGVDGTHVSVTDEGTAPQTGDDFLAWVTSLR